jgi:alpha/beta superfamily hydrolase
LTLLGFWISLLPGETKGVGSADAFVSPAQFQQYAQDMPEPRQYFVISGADHFWWGYEGEVAQKVAQFFSEGL